jgi:hypothetical protein
MLKLHLRKGEGEGANLSDELSVNKHSKGSVDWELAGDKPLPKAGKVVDHKTDLLNQRVAPKTELPHLAGVGVDQTVAAEG